LRPLIIDEETKLKIKQVIASAQFHPWTSDIMRKVMQGEYPPAGDYEELTVTIPVGYKAVFSLEEQPLGWCQHLSVSVDTDGKLPSQEAIAVVMEEFGMGNDLHDCINVWVDPDTQSINILRQSSISVV
jgi:hypothetical protein